MRKIRSEKCLCKIRKTACALRGRSVYSFIYVSLESENKRDGKPREYRRKGQRNFLCKILFNFLRLREVEGNVSVNC